MVDKKAIIVGGAIIGGLALIMLSGSTPAQVGAGGTKKEEDTTQPGEPGAPIYNITFPDPGFPSIPQPDYATIFQMAGGGMAQGTIGPDPGPVTYLSPASTKKAYISQKLQTIQSTPGTFAEKGRGILDLQKEVRTMAFSSQASKKEQAQKEQAQKITAGPVDMISRITMIKWR